ncbi:MAG: methylated-DNA--[protein]-cysteine S-methyltransferase [Myroides sp.]|nr:methylated-DNA--[protein]-cysteine S-methyltransferase [Myroides sp.]
MYQAIIAKDTSFEGVFFTTVITTGIFCRPSCTARKPKIENVEFFKTAKECIERGYRPCKVCKPLNSLNQVPLNIQEILEELRLTPSLKLKDEDLKSRAVAPSQVRRWFLKHHGMTFQAYQRLLRMNSAHKKIQEGESIINTAYDMGYESLSGFGESFKNVIGVSPKNGKQQQVIDLQKLETPIGSIVVCATKEGVCFLEFADIQDLDRELKRIAKEKQAVILQGENLHISQLKQELDAYFKGELIEFTVSLDLIGTPFQVQVWNGLRTIPYGETKSYKQQSELLNIPKSIRAVANANGMNTVAIVVPCHRIIGTDGSLTGYRGGVWRKKFLLELENKDYNKTEQLTLGFE